MTILAPVTSTEAGCYGPDAVATVIVSDETIRSLIEAHASMAAWYYQMSDALREAGATATAPTDDQRRAYVAQIGQHFPELAAAAEKITAPRPYIPPPAIPAPAEVVENEGVTIAEPPKDHIDAPEMVPSAAPAPEAPPEIPQAPPAGGAGSEPPKSTAAPPPPPPMVDPSKVKYED